MPVTIEEIARQLGVSPSTVSRALQDHPRISKETRLRVQAAAKALGYVPNYLALGLSSSRTRSIGVAVTHMSDPFVWPVVQGIEQTAFEHGYTAFISMTHGNRDKELAIIEEFRRRRVDGILIGSSHLARHCGETLRGIRTPVVLVNNLVDEEPFFRAAVDDWKGAQTAVEYLIKLGHQKIGFIGVPDRPLSSETRFTGYYETMDAAGLTPHAMYPEERQPAFDRYADFHLGRSIAQDIIAAKMTAVLCYNDMLAIGAITELRLRGVRVPFDVSVVGFDDIEMAEITTPALTTMRQPRHELGQAAAAILFDLLDDNPGHNEILPAELVIRDSAASF